MNELAKSGKRGVLLLSLSILLVSLHTIYYYNVSVPEVETRKIIQQIVRFCLTLLLLIFVFLGKKWAKNTMSVLLVFGVLMSLKVFTLDVPLINKSPMYVMLFVYSFGLYYLNVSKAFKEYLLYKNGEGGVVITIPTYSNNSSFSVTIIENKEEQLTVIISDNGVTEKLTLIDIDPSSGSSLSEMDPKCEDRPVKVFKSENCEIILPIEELEYEDDYIGFRSESEKWSEYSGIMFREDNL